MAEAHNTERGEVIALTERRPDKSPKEAGGIPFGGRVSRDANPGLPANEALPALLARLVFDDSLPFYLAALDGTILYLNEHYRKLDAALGDVTLSAGPADAGQGLRARSLTSLIADVTASGATVRAEEVALLGRGERVFLGRHMPVRSSDGTIVAVAGTYEDVTLQVRGIEEISRTHARFQDFTRASADWFFECGPDLKIRTLSDRFTAIMGQPSSLFLGATWEQIGRFEPNLDGQLDSDAFLKRRKPFRDLLFIIEMPDGEEKRFHLSAVPVFDRQTGDFNGFRGVGMDVGHRYRQAAEAAENRANLEKLLEELTRKNIALDSATAEARSALKAKNDFLATMSHELRTPLNAIIGFADGFESESFGPLEKGYRAYAGDIARAGRHLLSLINDILDVAVMEAGGIALKMGDLVVEKALERAVQMSLDKAKSKKLKLDKLRLTGEHWVKGDPKRVLQILVNLISNAVKFTPEGGEIGAELALDTENGRVHLTIWDTGVGIEEEDQQRVFEKFHQVTSDIYSREQEGTGLGLHISRQLARHMGGDIILASKPGAGSRFTVILDAAQGLEHSDENYI